jgi:Mg2+/Co2+ transporter CorB
MVVNDLAESRLMAAIQSGNLTSVMYWLNHNHSQYSNRLEIRGKVETSRELTPVQEKNITKALGLINFEEVKEINNESTK